LNSFNGFWESEVFEMKSARHPGNSSTEEEAVKLIADPLFLYKVGKKVGDLGVTGEERNRLILPLAGMTRTMPQKASVLLKGSTSSGKTTLAKSSIQLFPRECVLERAGLSPKALAHGEGSLAGKIFFINEYRCGKDSQLLLRLAQSDGDVKHEYATVRGSRRSTEIAERPGMPVVITTTTESKVYADDETRFLSIWADESPEQNLAIVLAKASGPRTVSNRDLPAWRMAMSLLTYKKGDFENPPAWLRYVAAQLPLDRVRVRRDFDRFLSLCSAIALCRGDWKPDSPVDITFPDYCVAYRILEPVLASGIRGLRTQEHSLAKAVLKLNKQLQRAATIKEIARELNWKDPVVYKYVKSASKTGVVEIEPGTREKNVKRITARVEESDRFLPSPRVVLENNVAIGREAKFVEPFTGVWETIKRSG
jgi:hypothetical protein